MMHQGRKPLSQILRQARESRKLSLQEVARLTRIPVKYLHLLEGAGDKQLLAEPLSRISSLRRYSAFLNLNPDIAVTQFIAELEQLPPVEEEARGGARPTQVLKHLPQPRARVLPQLRSRGLPRTILLLLALGLLAFVGYYSALTREQRPNEDKATPFPSPSASPTDAGQSEPFPPSPAVSPPVAVAPQAEPSAASAPQVKSPAVNSPPQPQKSPGSAPYRLRVQANAKTWLHVTIDDQPMKRLFLHSGQSLEWSAARGFTLSLGNAGGVKLTMDGQELPPVGKAGQMVLNVRLPSHR
jgi:cytoskeleton protein RodZ